MEAVAAAERAPDTTAPAPVGAPPTAASAPAVPSATPAPAAAAEPAEWLKSLGDYKSPDEVKQALGSLETLRANQLNDDQKAILRLAEDPAAWREFNELTHQDLKDAPDEEVLFRAFMRDRPNADPSEARYLFEQDQDRKYPGLADDADAISHKAHASERKREAEKERQNFDQQRTARLAELKKGALPAAGPTPDQEEKQRADYLAGLDKVLDSHKDGFTMKVDVDGGTLNLMVEPKDLPAFKDIMANPLGALLTEDKTALDPQKLMRYAAFQLRGDALLADAHAAGKVGGGPRLDVHELHNADGNPIPPAAGGDGSFLGAFSKVASPPARQPKY